MDNNKILSVSDLMLEFGGVPSMDWHHTAVHVELPDDGAARP